ncbi:MAG TPA: ABC transporter permease [Candidatus Saccharimonadales bacterium]|nr:ABC transporter permease [Candidatus Saccharimonadales bacterium]
MKIRDTAIRAGRSLRHAKARTLLTSLAISVGAFTVTVALAAGAGGQAYTDSLIKNNGDASNLTVFVKPEEADDAPKEYTANSVATQGEFLTDKDIDTIKKVAGVSEVTPSYNVSPTYMTRNGLDKKYETNINVKADRTGMPLLAGSLDNNQVPIGKVVIPEGYLEVLGFKNANEAIGQTITVRFEKATSSFGAPAETFDKVFTIAAVDKKSATVLRYQTALNISPTDAKTIHDEQVAGSSQQKDTYASVNVHVADGSDVTTVQKAIEAAGNYKVFSLQDLQQALFQFINVIQYGASGFGFLAILASVFGIINTQYISVLERTQQIGLMKALGARRKDVGRLFRYEAAWVGFLGGAIGTIFALLTGLLNPWIASSLSLEKGTELLKFSPVTSVVLIVGLMIVAVAAGYFPARKAAKLDPIEALRTE